MFVNRIPFLVSVLRRVNFTMVEYVSRRLNTILPNSIEKIFQFYKNNGYTIETFLMDMELEWIYDSLPEKENINAIATNEHVT